MFKELLKEALVKGLTRHGASGTGGALILEGVRTDSTELVIAGAGAWIAAYGFSVARKWRRARSAKKAALAAGLTV